MSLLALKSHLQTVKISSLQGLIEHFGKDADVLRAMLMHWMRKGSLKCFNKKQACGLSCVKCDTTAIEIYEWLN